MTETATERLGEGRDFPPGPVTGLQALVTSAAGRPTQPAAQTFDAQRVVTRQSVQMAAFAVSMSAKTDGLTQGHVDDMRANAEQVLDHDDPLRLECLRFATQFEANRNDAYAMRKFGEALDAAVRADLNPDRRPPAFRRDIDG